MTNSLALNLVETGKLAGHGSERQIIASFVLGSAMSTNLAWLWSMIYVECVELLFYAILQKKGRIY